MTISATAAAVPSSQRTRSLTTGVFYLLTFVSIPTLVLYTPVKSANYIVGTGPDTRAIVGGLLEIIVAVAGIGTAVVLFPLLIGKLRRQRSCPIPESGRRRGPVRPIRSASYNRIFLLGQSFMPAICDLLLGVLLYQSRLVPRRLSVIGIVGAPILVAGYLAVLFGLIGQRGPLAGLSAFPVAIFEFSLGVWLVVRGFDPAAVAVLESRSSN